MKTRNHPGGVATSKIENTDGILKEWTSEYHVNFCIRSITLLNNRP
jgi:hypothetical protein